MSDIHIASCVVHARADALSSVVSTIHAQSLAEIPAVDPRGRIVIVLEGPNAGAVLDRVDLIRALPGVVAVNLVYQHTEAESTLQELLP